ncbi:RluA family pseudouridine synthase [Ructibacterium gallinarum]|uniref:RNA pseudouridylate synthase n=1 Tax=Ructibacterium gallinarum TaxID=2779355 RepID=A0A9D5R8Q4_9FIRM|nr:RluA family pseudouridine synthase [Ructibacterium gallinarum]MBE5040661.1 RluA family pseudouridine synthase [Ructibacterium gallinarum]
MKKFVVGRNDVGQRLDRFLEKLMPGVPRGEIYRSLRKKKVKINQKRITAPDLRLKEGDVAELYISDSLFPELEQPFWMGLRPEVTAVYEDAHILILNKPSGLICQAEAEPSLEGYMRAYLWKKGEFDPAKEHGFLPSLCHRIDRNTAGLVIGAKDAESLRILNEKIRRREIKKFYLCETETPPRPAEGVLSGWLCRDEKRRKMVPAREDDPDAVRYETRYRVLRMSRPALVEAELMTGRTHQIRAGFAAAGYPLAGDVKYGAKKDGTRRYQHLAAYKIVFAFTSDSGILEYLTEKEIALSTEEAGF